MKRFLCDLIIVLLVLGIGSTARAEFRRIDDMTVIENGRTVILPDRWERPVRECSFKEGSRGFNDGYMACSASDNVFPFDLTTHVPGSAVDLPGSFNYPYDAMLKPDGSELWITDASDDSVFVFDRSTNTLVHTIYPGTYMIGLAFSGDGTLIVLRISTIPRQSVRSTLFTKASMRSIFFSSS